MQEMREVKMPSGATLKVSMSPFSASKALYQALLREMKGIAIPQKDSPQVESMLKDALCAGFSSPYIEECLWECMKKCTYNGLKIDVDTFEPAKAREDYIPVCVEVVKDNVLPFAKSLYADYKRFMSMTESTQA